MKSHFTFPLYLSLLAVVCPLSIVQAQIIPDQTLGAENSVVVPDVINGINSDRLEGGAVRGSNLFHSFQEFNIKAGQGAYFSNPQGIANIFSRVTGGNLSQIMGTLGVLGNANLYFLNPNGILFGPNAQLDIKGSFLATTADSFQFPNAYAFSASNPTAPPLLTVNIPVGLNFRTNSSATITNQGDLRTVQNLTLAGENLNLQGQLQARKNLSLMAQDTVKIRDSQTTPFIAAAGENLTIQGNQTVDIFALNHPRSGLFSGKDMTLRSLEKIGGDAHFWSGGNFRIEQLDGHLGTLESPHDPVIRTAGDVFIGAYQGASLHIIAGGSVEIPDYVWITGADPRYGLQEQITLTNGTVININGKTQPTLDIRAGVDPSAIGEPFFQGTGEDFFTDPFFSAEPSSASIRLGSLFFRDLEFNRLTGRVLLTNQYQPNLNLIGGIEVNSTIADPNGSGNLAIETGSRQGGGLVAIDAYGPLVINGNIRAGSLNRGGQVLLNSEDRVVLGDNSLVTVRAATGGNIGINTPYLEMNPGSSLVAGISAGLGSPESRAGDIDIAAGLIVMAGENLIANQLDLNTMGQGGNINITTGALEVLGGSQINASTFGRGNAGNINIRATDYALFSGFSQQGPSGTLSTVGGPNIPNVVGNGGNVNLRVGNLYVENGAQLQALIYGQGNAGKLTINADQGIYFTQDGSAFSTVERGAIGNGGAIALTAQEIELTQGSRLDATTNGRGNAGPISLKAETIKLENSEIVSAVSETGIGNGGKITITAQTLDATQGGELFSLTAGEGNAGNIGLFVDDSITFDGRNFAGKVTGVSTGVNRTGRGQGGTIQIQTRNLTVTNGAQLQALSRGQGDAGRIDIKTTEQVRLSGQGSSISSTIEEPTAIGQGGIIQIQTPQLTLLNGAQISTSTLGQGDGGNILINAPDAVLLSGVADNGQPSIIASTVEAGGNGNGGNITLKTGILGILAGASLSTGTSGLGNAGNIRLTVSGFVVMDGVDPRFDAVSGVFSSVDTPTAIGNAGTITLNSQNLLVTNGAQLVAVTRGQGNAGQIRLQVADTAIFQGGQGLRASGAFTAVNQGAIGNGGNLSITTRNLFVTDGAQLSANTNGLGDAGIVSLAIAENTVFSGTRGNFPSSALSSVNLNGRGNGGDIRIKTQNLALLDGGQLLAVSRGQGKAGDIQITANDVLFSGVNAASSLFSTAASTLDRGAIGAGGNINIVSNTLRVEKGAQLNASTLGQGNAGNITLNIADTLEVTGVMPLIQFEDGAPGGFSSGIYTTTEVDARGTGGNITLKAPQISINRGGLVSARSRSAFDGGVIELITNSLDLSQGGQIQSTAFNQGNAGQIVINAKQGVTIAGIDQTWDSRLDQLQQLGFTELENFLIPLNASSGIFANTQPGARGNGGSIQITTPNLTLNNQGQISAATAGSGKGGDIRLQNLQHLTVKNSTISASSQDSRAGNVEINTAARPVNLVQLNQGSLSVQAIGTGNAGTLTLNAKTVNLNNQSAISASTRSGTGGDITLNQLETLQVNNSEISASTVTGKAGSLAINPNQKPVNAVQLNRGSLAVKATETGNSGNLTLNAKTITLNNHAEISAATNSGQGGNVDLEGIDTLRINNSNISASTVTGEAGSVEIKASQGVNLNNQARITVEATEGGVAGNLKLTTDQLSLNNSQITVSSPTGQAGNITIQSQDIDLNNSAITAETGKSDVSSGANINLNATNLLTLEMRNNSLISATANDFADGGNIRINTPFLIAFPSQGGNGNDIVAKAFFGDGGRITINALGIFGISEGKALVGNYSNDIDASSEYGASGVITLNQAIDPNRGLVTLPSNVIDPNSLIEQNVCQRRRQGQSQLTTKDKTDLPPGLGDNFQGIDNGVKLVEPSLEEEESQVNPPLQSFSQIIPAQGWQRLANGKILLVSEPLPSMASQRSPVLSPSCSTKL